MRVSDFLKTPLAALLRTVHLRAHLVRLQHGTAGGAGRRQAPGEAFGP